MFIKRMLSVVVAVCLLLSICVIPTYALAQEEIVSPSAILMEPESLKILFEKNAHEIRACASITKVMTMLLVFEAIEEGRIGFEDIVTTSEHAKSMGGSDIWLEVGEQMTVHEMLKAVAVASANDAAVALAEHICGTEDEFVEKMNEKAQELNMEHTVFKNCNGLDEEGHLTCAYDVALMSCELMKHEKVFEYTNIWIDTLRGGETQIVNTNKLLKSYNGITGLKTGTTSQAGSCISASAKRDGMSLLAVVLGADTGTDRFKDAAVLLDFGFANFEVVKLNDSLAGTKDIKVDKGMQTQVPVLCENKGDVVVSKGSSESVKQSVEVKESVEAPVKAGQKVGTVTYTLDSATVSQLDIVTAHSVDRMSFSKVFSELLRATFVL